MLVKIYLNEIKFLFFDKYYLKVEFENNKW